MKILVLGKNGMLGSMVYRYLSEKYPDSVDGWARSELLVENFLAKPFKIEGYDYVINCIGLIHKRANRRDLIEINALFPHRLADFCYAKVIHASTDCVYSGEEGYYYENEPANATDDYGRTKALGEVLDSPAWLNIRCSLIGTTGGLLKWFLDYKGERVPGFAHYYWNGITTLQFAEFCYQLIKEEAFDAVRADGAIFHYCPNEDIRKSDLLRIFNAVFDRKKEIYDVREAVVNRVLRTNFSSLQITKRKIGAAVAALRDYDSRRDISLSADTGTGTVPGY